ncbi:MAG: cyclic nucleotide-binding domain-containing protein [Spirochaetes bacterium]|nr:cyclic nucleotide-binding domain-containing protein [Spirochaetota bacterium]MBU1081460.1 cyclic nucleotide-binding domain-containing protein [Spirochaetota bacterium]
MSTRVGDESLVEEARRIIAFKFMSDVEAGDLLGVSSIVEAQEGQQIVAQGEEGSSLFGILEGSVAVSVTAEEGRDVYMNTLGIGDIFGEAGLFMNVKRTATVTATCDSSILKIQRKDFARFIKMHPEAGNKVLLVFIYSLLRKLRMANEELAFERKGDFGQADVDAMMASLFGDKD